MTKYLVLSNFYPTMFSLHDFLKSDSAKENQNAKPYNKLFGSLRNLFSSNSINFQLEKKKGKWVLKAIKGLQVSVHSSNITSVNVPGILPLTIDFSFLHTVPLLQVIDYNQRILDLQRYLELSDN